MKKLFILIPFVIAFNLFAYTNQKLIGTCTEVPSEKCLDCCKIITYLGSKSFNIKCPSDLSKKMSRPKLVLNELVENSINQYDIPGATYSIYKSLVENLTCGDIKVFFQPMLRKTLLLSSCIKACSFNTKTTEESTDPSTTTSPEGEKL